MTAVLAGRRFRLTIGGNDWSNWCIEAALQCEELDLGDGLIRTSATFTLDVSERLADATYRLNPTQWAKGTAVLFEIENDSQVMTVPNCPTGQLFILKEPSAPSITNPVLTLECGCILSLKDFQTPDADDSGVTVGVSTNRETITANILTAAGVASSLTAINHPLDYPVPKRGGSLVQLAGKLAIAGNSFLYVDSSGDAKNKSVDVDPSTATLSVTVGQNEAFWEPSEDSETPAEKLIVSGVSYDVDGLPYTEVITTTSGTVASISPYRKTDYTPIDPITRTTVRTYQYDPNTKTQRTETIEEQVLGAFYPRANTGNPAYFQLFTTKTETEIKTYDGLKLIRESCDVYVTPDQTNYPFNLSRSQATQLIYFSNSVTRYFYDEIDVIQKTIIESKKTFLDVSLFPSLRETRLVPIERIESTWEQINPDTWVFTKASSVPFLEVTNRREFDDLGRVLPEYYELAQKPTETTIANDGSINPPQTQYLSENKLREKAIDVCVNTQGLATTTAGALTKDVRLDHAVSVEQLYDYGTNYSAFLWGRRYGWRVGIPFSDTVLGLSPLDRIDVTDGATIYRLLADGLSYVLTSTEAYAFFNGIEVGTAPTNNPTSVTKLYDLVNNISFLSQITGITSTFSIDVGSENIVFNPVITLVSDYEITEESDIEFADTISLTGTFTIEDDSESNIVFSDSITIASVFRIQ